MNIVLRGLMAFPIVAAAKLLLTARECTAVWTCVAFDVLSVGFARLVLVTLLLLIV